MTIIQSNNLVSIIQNNAINQPKQLAYLFLSDGKQETMRIYNDELDEKARIIAATLQKRKLFSKRVLLLYPSGIDFIAAFIGCLYAGVIAVPVHCPKLKDFDKSKKNILTVAKDADVTGVLTVTEYINKIDEDLSELHLKKKKIFSIDTTILQLDSLEVYKAPIIKPDTIAYLQYTSGSASIPKAAIICHENLIHNLKQSAKAWHYSSNSITVTWAPHTHVYGLVFGLLTPLYTGSRAILIPAEVIIQKPSTWLKAITHYKATHSGCPNFGYQLCIEKISDAELDNINLASWKVAVNGGEVIHYETLQKFAAKFQRCFFSIEKFCPAYGMSEMTGTIAVNAYGKKPNFYNLSTEGLSENKVVLTKTSEAKSTFAGCGHVLPGLEAVIVDPETHLPAPSKTIGEIWLRGKSLVSGYWQNKQETAYNFDVTLAGSKEKYFRTGDLGFIYNKEICITGRLKDLIIIYGKKYYPTDLEIIAAEALKNILVTGQRVVFALPSEDSGKERVVFLQEIEESLSSKKHTEIINTIATTITKRLGINPYCITLVATNSLPKTKSGKLQRKTCQELFLANQLNVVAQKIISSFPSNISSTSTQFENDFIKILAPILKIKPENIHLSAPINQYDFDSINITQLITLLNETYNLTLTPDQLYGYTTLQNFVDDILNQKKSLGITSTATQASNTKHIAIIGMSAILPSASDLTMFWQNLLNNTDAIQEIPPERWAWQDYVKDEYSEKIKWGGFITGIKQFDASFFSISPREAELMDPQHRLFLQTAWSAIEHAGYATHTLSALKAGVFVGVFNNDYAELLKTNGIIDAYCTIGITRSVLANRVSYLLNLHGPSETIDTACSSSLVAMHHAVQAIQQGDCELAIVGGSNALLTATNFQAASEAGMLSEGGRCKTFDKNADGYVRAEGVAAIILKPLDKAQADGDVIYGIIKGTAVNHGGQTNSLTAPNPNAQAEVITMACQRADIPINSISYIETHGTGTPLGDPIEINGLKKAFSNLADKSLPYTANYCGLGSVKSNIGHLEAAAGIAGVLKVLLAMQHQYLPSNLHLNDLNPYIDLKDSPFYIVNHNQPWKRLSDFNNQEIPRRAGISSFGFGGTNAHIILEEAPADMDLSTHQNHLPFLITLSAKTEAALQQRIQDLYNWLDKTTEKPSIAAISYTLNIGRDHFNKRCALIVNNVQELKDTLSYLLTDQIPENCIINNNETNKDRIKPIFNELFNKLMEELSNYSLLSLIDYKNKLLALGNFYTEGYSLDWKKLHHGKKQRIALPTYPFAKDSYWLPENKLPTLLPLKENNNAVPITLRIQQDISHSVATLLKIPINAINTTKTLTELGFDSITFKELSTSLEKYYDIELNPAIFFTHTSIQTISNYLWKTHSANIALKYSVREEKKSTEELPTHPLFKNNQLMKEPIAIIGMQGYFPQSDDLTSFWNNLENSRDLITEIPPNRWGQEEYYIPEKSHYKWGGFLNDITKFDADFFNISAREANLMDPQQRLLLEVTWKTLEDAGYDPFGLSGRKVGIFIGTEFNDYQMLIRAQQKIFHGHVATGNSHAILANRISYFFNLNGPSETTDTACSSSLIALHRAIVSLQQGECTVAIAGGVSLIIDPYTYITTAKMNVLSSDGHCKTFDKSANGYVKGEGVATVMLKPLSQAKQDGDFIYGIIKGSAVNHGGKAQSITAPNASAQTKLLIDAYTQANIDPHTVTYIEAHGTGTELGDPIEIEGLKNAFNTLCHTTNYPQKFCGLGSVKTQIGHLEPASGIASVIKVLLAMHHEKIPGNLHLNTVNPYIDLTHSPFYLVNKTQPWERILDQEGNLIPFRAGVSSFGFGGTNAHIVLEEFAQHKQNASLHKPSYLLTLSAKREASLKQKIIDLHAWLMTDPSNLSLEDLSFTLNTGRAHFAFRCAVVADSLTELSQTLHALITTKSPNNSILSSDTSIHINQADHAALYQTSIEKIKQYNNLSPLEYRDNLLKLGQLYTKGHTIEWDEIHINESKKRLVGLPTYPFIKERYWFDQELEDVTTSVCLEPALSLQDFTLNYLKDLFSTKLRISPDKIDFENTYENFGVDSLLGLEITNQLESDFGTLSKTLLYERNTLLQLADYLQKNFLTTLEKLFSNKTYSPPTSLTKSATAISPVVSSFLPDSTMEDDIAIIGLSGTFPMAANIQQFWQNLVESRDCITEIPNERWDYKDYPIQMGTETHYYKYGGFIPDIDKFDPLFFKIAPREAAMMDPQERLFMQSAWTTLEDAGYTRASLEKKVNNKVGVFAGVTYNFYPLFTAEEWTKGNRQPLDIQLFSVANRISYFLNLSGPSYIVDTACSSSLAAIHLACESLRRGECLMAFAGGVNLSLHPAKYHFLGSFSFLSLDGRCASFATGGSGYVPGEGVSTVLLKPLSLALQDQDAIYGIIKSSSMNHGGKTSGYTVPNPTAQAELIKNALLKSKIDPRSISYIEAHGTGTSLGDPIEIRGLQDAFNQFTPDKQFCAIGSVKSNIGHLEAAAGISQLAKVLLQMQHKKLAPSLHAETLNPYIDFSQTPFFVQRELNDWIPPIGQPRRAGISSFGAGGTNVHLIVEEFIPPSSLKIDNNFNKPFIFLLSAINSERLEEYLHLMKNFLTTEKVKHSDPMQLSSWLEDICHILQVGRESMPSRLAIMATSSTELLNKIDNCSTPIKANDFVWHNHPTSNKRMTDDEAIKLIRASQYEQLVKLWIDGTQIPWEHCYPSQPLPHLYLPSYPFTKRRCWVTSEDEKPITSPSNTPHKTTAIAEMARDWLYHTQWQLQSLAPTATTTSTAEKKCWLIFSDNELGYLLQDHLQGSNFIYCFTGSQFKKLDENIFYLNPDSLDDYHQLFNNLSHESKSNLQGILYLWALPTSSFNSQQADLFSLSKNHETSYQLLYLFQALMKQSWPQPVPFWLITRSSQPVIDHENIQLWQHHLWSMTRIFAAEQPQYKTMLIDLDSKKSLQLEASTLAAEVKTALFSENHIAYREGQRYVNRLLPYMPPTQPINWQPPETALITGGLGALGIEVATWLAKQGTQYFLLTGNTLLPDRPEWDHVTESSLLEKIQSILQLEQLGTKVKYFAVDVSDKAGMQQVITQTEQAWKKPIKGVFHLAGVTTDSITLENTSKELLQKVLAPKVQGALVLHDLFKGPDLNCFVLFSSIAALPYFGMKGLSAYAMANEFLSGLAAFRQNQGLPAINIHWAAWADKGMSFRYDHSAFLEAVGMSTISISLGVEILHYLLTLQPTNIIVFKIAWEKFLQVNVETKKLPFFAHFTQQYQASDRKTEITIRDHSQIMQLVTHILAKLLELSSEEINSDTPYQDYGLDSISGVHFVAELNKHFPDIISPMDLYRYPTINQLVNYLIQQISTVATSPLDPNNTLQPTQPLYNKADLTKMLEDELAELEL
jgi:acyl transferase domain-containing protein/acyl-CoA synthetase (AMP-forming)/AMP-acid ligase II/aryl carrier-like protein